MIDFSKSEKYLRLKHFGMGPYAMKSMRVCKKCGRITEGWSLFCPACKKILSGGTLFDTYKKMHIRCLHCKTVLAADTQYCPSCGRKVDFGANE